VSIPIPFGTLCFQDRITGRCNSSSMYMFKERVLICIVKINHFILFQQTFLLEVINNVYKNKKGPV